jgi:hypothetical protein
MFGLMRPRSCAGKQEHRVYYCGSCKTLGSEYGQKSRLLLNHDMVFLAELLGQLGGAPREWGPAYRSYNCMSMPSESPAVLRYAAAATVVLTHYTIEDHAGDTGRRRWRIARRLFHRMSRQALDTLGSVSFPVDALDAALRSQPAREASATSIDQVAHPTAVATALFFEHGAAIVGRPELSAALNRIGMKFGELVYLLDAYEDFERDLSSGAFNALRATGRDKAWAKQQLLALASELELLFAELPLDAAFRAIANARLHSNLAAKFGDKLPLLHNVRRCEVHRESWKERWRKSVAFAKQLRETENPGWLKGAAMVASVSFIAFVVPQWARGTHSSKECLSLGFNLMAIGS